MTFVAHLVRADVRRFRLLLAGWVLIQVTSTVFAGLQAGLQGDPRTMTAVGLLATVLFLTRWLGMIVIVVLVVQTHPLVGSDAFWMTRPIPAGALLWSKLVLLATTLVFVPALCDVALTAVFRVPVAEMALVALQTMLFQSLWLAIVMALSAWTRNLPRFVLVAGGVLVSLALLMSIGIAIAMRQLTDGPQLGPVQSRAAPNPLPVVAMVVGLIAAAVVPIVVQYRTRLTRVSVGVGIASLAVAILVVWMWPWRVEPVAVPGWASQPSALRLIAESPTGEFSLRETWPGLNRTDTRRIGKVHLRLLGIEPGWLATIRLADGTVQFDDGVTLRTAGNEYQERAPFEAWTTSRTGS